LTSQIVASERVGIAIFADEAIAEWQALAEVESGLLGTSPGSTKAEDNGAERLKPLSSRTMSIL
jgi:hypothetical protein